MKTKKSTEKWNKNSQNYVKYNTKYQLMKKLEQISQIYVNIKQNLINHEKA